MAQPGNDNQKSGVVSSYADNVHQGVVSGGDNFTPLSMATSEDGDDTNGPNRDQRVIPGRTGWLFPDKPGID